MASDLLEILGLLDAPTHFFPSAVKTFNLLGMDVFRLKVFLLHILPDAPICCSYFFLVTICFISMISSLCFDSCFGKFKSWYTNH
jgi:hypothetical protein